MYKSDNFKQLDNETFTLKINTDRDYKILQLTDLHLGFGMFSRKKDRLALPYCAFGRFHISFLSKGRNYE